MSERNQPKPKKHAKATKPAAKPASSVKVKARVKAGQKMFPGAGGQII